MLNNYFRLCKIAEANKIEEPGLEGRKRLQKIAFISKALGYPIGTPFVFHLQGPYSPGLAAHLNEAREFGLLIGSSEEPYRLTSYGLEFLHTFLSEHPEEKPPLRILESVSKEVGACPTADLELLATLFYLDDVGYNNRTEAAKKVGELKPEKFSTEKIAAALETKERLQGFQ